MIIRSPRSRNFTIIGNEIFDSVVSLEAIGLLHYLLSRPDNWRILPAQLADKFTGRDRTYRILKELIDARYVVRKKLNDGSVQYTVFDAAQPDPEKAEMPITAKPDPEKADVLLTTDRDQGLTESKTSLKDRSLALQDDWPPDAWDQFWQAFPNKVGKPVAMRKFDSARRRCPSWARFWAGVQRYVNKTDDRPWLNPSTFLNQDRWDEAPAPRPVKGGSAGPSFFDAAMGGDLGGKH